MSNNWNNDERKTQKTIIFVLVIIMLLLVIAILGVLFFKLLSEYKSESTSDTAILTTVSDTTKATTTTKTTTTTTTTVKATTKALTTTKETTTKQTTTPAPTTVKVIAAPKASIQASLYDESNYPNQGVTVYLSVSGNYVSYSYKISTYSPDGSVNISNGTSSASNLEITAFSGGLTKIVADVTPYNSDGITGDTVTATYVPSSGGKSNASSIVPCTRYGQIYAPGGGPINGYSTSYIVNGGGYSCTRVDLMDQWHVTAVNSFSASDGTTYYELYDTDDGDYYGWVPSYNISFY